ncbi:hypothetical protein JZU46_07435, partial [bacterium]|nr:hypothetical protein [bacterium]
MLPATVQISGVVELNVTALPDAPPVADTEPEPPTVNEGAEPKLMLCLICPSTTKTLLTVTRFDRWMVLTVGVVASGKLLKAPPALAV